MGEFFLAIVKICGDGDHPNFAQSGGRDTAKLPKVLNIALAQLREC